MEKSVKNRNPKNVVVNYALWLVLADDWRHALNANSTAKIAEFLGVSESLVTTALSRASDIVIHKPVLVRNELGEYDDIGTDKIYRVEKYEFDLNNKEFDE